LRIGYALALLAANAIAAPFAVQVGDARLALDAPAGFSDTQFTGSPRLAELAESMTPASNRILLFALEDADLRRFMSGDSIELKRTALAATPRGMERERLSPGAFKAFTAEALPERGTPAATKQLTRYLDAQPLGRANLLAELRADPEVVSVLQGTRLPPSRANEAPRYLVSSNTLILVRGKALSLAVFTRYESAADLDWIRAATSRWIDELQRLNSR
jgi:hypothetical protein